MENYIEPMCYSYDKSMIKSRTYMKTQNNILLEIVDVLYRSNELYKLKVRVARGVELPGINEGNRDGINVETLFEMQQDPKIFCIWIQRVSEKELDRLRMIGRID